MAVQRKGTLSTLGPAGVVVAAERLPSALLGHRFRVVAICVACVLLPASIYYASSDFGDDPGSPVFNSPLANSNFVLARQLAAGQGFTLPLPHYEELPSDIAVALPPRDAALLEGHVIPKTFLPELIAVAGLLRLGEMAILWAKPLLGGLAVLGVFVVAHQLATVNAPARHRVSGLLAGGTAATLFALHPAQWIVHSAPFTLADTLALVFLVYGMAAALPLLGGSSRSAGRASVVGALLALSVAFRYPNLFLVAFPLAAVLLGTRDARVAAGLAGPLLLTGLVLASLHFVVYGSPTTTGHQLTVASLDEAVTLSSSGFLGFNAAAFSRYLDYYLTSPQLVGVAAAGIVAIVAGYRSGSRAFRAYGAVAVAMTGTLLVVYGGQESHGVVRFAVNASLMRYLLPAVALLIPVAVYGSLVLVRVLGERSPAHGYGAAVAAVGALSFLLAASVHMAVDGNGGVVDRRQTVERLTLAREQILPVTDERSIIITRLYDKLLFPHRSTLVATFLIGKGEVIEKGADVTWSFVPGTERLADVSARVTERGYRLFLLNDRIVASTDMAEFRERLAGDGLTLERVESVSAVQLYEVKSAPGPAGLR